MSNRTATLRTAFGDVVVGPSRGPASSPVERELADRALSDLLFELRHPSPEFVRDLAAVLGELGFPSASSAARLLEARVPPELAAVVARDLRSAAQLGRVAIAPLSELPLPPAVRTGAPVARAPSPSQARPPPAERRALPAEPVEQLKSKFELRVVDEMDEPIDGVDVAFSVAGKREVKPTGGDGVARLEDQTTSFGSARIVDTEALREKLKPRWDTIREGPRVEPAPGVTVVSLKDPLPSVGLESDTLHTLSIQPRVIRVRFLGMFFDTSKSFLLPSAMAGIRGVKRLYDENPGSKLLVVGHTDTQGKPSYNDPLSVERADAIAAYLTDAVEDWFKWYGESNPKEKRWGQKEDLMMISALPDAAERDPSEDPVSWFQRTRGLKVDGIAGPITRRALIKDYMALDETTLPPGTELVTHGCGENFPVDESGENIDPDPENPKRDAPDRRADLFFFDGKLGIQPPPPGKNSKPGSREYPEWVRRSRETHDHGGSGGLAFFNLRVRMLLEGDAIASEEYTVLLDGKLQLRGTTDAEGLVDQVIPASAQNAEISFANPDIPVRQIVPLSSTQAFPKVDTMKGQQLRLKHLAFFEGDVDGADGPLTQNAVKRFQKAHGLPETGQGDAATQDKLKQEYGS